MLTWQLVYGNMVDVYASIVVGVLFSATSSKVVVHFLVQLVA